MNTPKLWHDAYTASDAIARTARLARRAAQVAEVRGSLSVNALECLAQVGVDDETIVTDLRTDPAELLNVCLNGADGADVVAGWTEYVDVVARVAASARAVR